MHRKNALILKKKIVSYTINKTNVMFLHTPCMNNLCIQSEFNSFFKSKNIDMRQLFTVPLTTLTLYLPRNDLRTSMVNNRLLNKPPQFFMQTMQRRVYFILWNTTFWQCQVQHGVIFVSPPQNQLDNRKNSINVIFKRTLLFHFWNFYYCIITSSTTLHNQCSLTFQ